MSKIPPSRSRKPLTPQGYDKKQRKKSCKQNLNEAAEIGYKCSNQDTVRDTRKNYRRIGHVRSFAEEIYVKGRCRFVKHVVEAETDSASVQKESRKDLGDALGCFRICKTLNGARRAAPPQIPRPAWQPRVEVAPIASAVGEEAKCWSHLSVFANAVGQAYRSYCRKCADY